MNPKALAESIFLASVKSVLPSVLLGSNVAITNNTLKIYDHVFALEDIKNIYVIGAGKASAMMADVMENILGPVIKEGHIVVKYGHSCKLKYIRLTEAGHPVPDVNGYKATEEILRIAAKAKEGDLILCLISGGGSALLADVPEGISSEAMNELNYQLVNSGADITGINTVRKHLSYVKGGQLARAAFPATLISLIISDVPGDPVDVIASGPTSPDNSTFGQSLNVLEKYNILSSVPECIKNYLESGKAGLWPETPKPGDPVFDNTFIYLIGTNSIALEAAKKAANEYSTDAVIIESMLHGDVTQVADYIVNLALQHKVDPTRKKPVCLLFGGEPTVKMTGNGLGGRNQHLALLVSLLIKDHPGISFLSAGTDGNDGPTTAAGAVVDSETYQKAVSGNISPEKFIIEFDSFHFFEKAGGHIITGPTMTNVMDIIVVIVE